MEVRAKCISSIGGCSTGNRRALFAAGKAAMTEKQAERLIMALHLARLQGIHPGMDSTNMFMAYRKVGPRRFDELEQEARKLRKAYVRTR